jgi:hypothetical protein
MSRRQLAADADRLLVHLLHRDQLLVRLLLHRAAAGRAAVAH